MIFSTPYKHTVIKKPTRTQYLDPFIYAEKTNIGKWKVFGETRARIGGGGQKPVAARG
jgi:hypothetical protein